MDCVPFPGYTYVVSYNKLLNDEVQAAYHDEDQYQKLRSVEHRAVDALEEQPVCSKLKFQEGGTHHEQLLPQHY